MKSFITTFLSIAFLNAVHAKNLEIEDYCNYKQSASHVTINLPITLKYKDGTSFAKYLFISCSKGSFCTGFISGGGASIRAANGSTWVLDALTVKHMGKDSVVLVSGINEFLLDVPSKLFRWTENSSVGGIAEYRCSKIFSE